MHPIRPKDYSVNVQME